MTKFILVALVLSWSNSWCADMAGGGNFAGGTNVCGIKPTDLINETDLSCLYHWQRTVAEYMARGDVDNAIEGIRQQIVENKSIYFVNKWVCVQNQNDVDSLFVDEMRGYGEWVRLFEIKNIGETNEGLGEFLSMVKEYLSQVVTHRRDFIEMKKNEGMYDKEYSTEEFLKNYLYYFLSYA